MATSVENRQLINSLETVVPLGFKTGKLRSGGFSLAPSPPAAAAVATKKKMDENSESEEEEEDWEGPIEALCGEEEEESILDPRDEGTADAWIKRNPSLIRLTGKHPFNSEPPLASLMNHGFITPVPLHYVRNHGPVPNATWHEWTVEVCGLVKRPTKFTMPQLVQDFTPRQFPVTLVCAGNRRKEQNMVKQTVGFNWGPAGVATSVWRGVGLRDVLKRCGILKGALNVCFLGAEDLPAGGAVSKYGTSIKREVAMDPSRDIIIAYMQNGELLAPDHGFPVRMIIPGFIGGRMVKWLTRIIVTTVESDNYYHYRDNRVLPSHVDAELANSEAWWYKPEYIINDLNINSVITTPGHAELLPINSGTTQRPYTLRGYAYSGGGKKVTRVEVTLDGGETWLLANLLHHEKPNKYGRYWCWCFWSLDLEVDHLLDTKEIAVRAWDETLNTQPEKLIWNLMGMMNNCWFRVKTSICKTDKGEIGLLFQHPTQPGNQSGGWMMVKEKKPSTPATTNGNGSTKQMTMSEVKKHSNEESAWIVVHGHVYDCTRFLKDHPGGADSILINAGTDCTEDFDAIHSDKAKSMLQDYMIGKISEESKVTESSSHLATGAGAGTALDSGGNGKNKKVPCKLISKTIISHDVRLFRFALPSENQVLGLPVGKHIYLCATINGKLCMRAYTPTSKADQTGHFDLLVKIYFKGVHPDYPNGGLMSQYLESSVAIGSMLEIKGPLGHIEYKGGGNFMVGGKPMLGKKRLAMVAGGTGITPIYQVIQAVLNDPDDHTQIHLVYANRTEDDILLRTELDDWARKYPDLFSVWYVISKKVNKDKCWPYSLGYISESILSQHIPEGGSDDTLALVCGPPAMIKLAVLPNLEKLNYDINKSCLQF